MPTDERKVELPFRLTESRNVTKLVELVYSNQSTGIEKDGPEGNAALLFAWGMSQGIVKTIVSLLESQKSPSDVRKITEGLKAWCHYD